MPISDLLLLIGGLIVLVLSGILVFLSVLLSRARSDMVGPLFLLASVSLFICSVFEVIFLYIGNEWLSTFLFIQEIFLFLAVIVLIAITILLSRAQAKEKTIKDVEKEPVLKEETSAEEPKH